MPLRDDLKANGIDPTNTLEVLRWVARLPIVRTERIRLLREYEAQELRLFDPRQFAQAVNGIPPS